MHKRKRYIR